LRDILLDARDVCKDILSPLVFFKRRGYNIMAEHIY